MAASAGDGIKFVMYFSVEGSGEDDLKRIANAMKGITTSANQAEDAMGGFAQQAMAVQQAFDKIGEAGQKMFSAGITGIKMYAGGVEEMMNSLSPFESSINRMMMVGKKSRTEAIALANQSIDLVKYTPFQAEQIMKIQESLAAAKVSLDNYKNAAGGMMTLQDAVAQGFSHVDKATLDMAKGMHINATSAMADLATMAGQSGYQMTTFVRGMDRALQTGNLRMLFDQMPVAMRKAIFETTGGQMKITAQKAMDNMFKFLSEEGNIGAAAMASSTYDGIIQNFKDLPVMFADAIAGIAGEHGFYDQIRFALADLFASIQPALDKEGGFMKAVKEGFAPLMDLVVGGLKLASVAVKGFVKLVSDHPGLVKFGTMLGLAGSALLTLGGAALIAVGSLGGIVAAITTIVTVVAPVLPMVLGVAAAFTALAVGGIAVAGAAALAFANDFAGIKTLFTDVYVVGKAVVDVLSDWNGSLASISLESKAALEERGLMGSFLKVVNLIRQVETFFEGFGQSFMKRWEVIGAKFGVAWDTMSGAFGRIGTAIKAIIGVVTGGLDKSQALVDQATGSGMDWGNAAADILDTVADVATSIAAGIDAAIAATPDLIAAFATVYSFIGKSIAVAQAFGNSFMVIASQAKVAFNAVMADIMPVLEAMYAVSAAGGMLASGNVIGAGRVMLNAKNNIQESAIKYHSGVAEGVQETGQYQMDVAKNWEQYDHIDDQKTAMLQYASDMRAKGTVRNAQQRVHEAGGLFPTPPELQGAPPPKDQWEEINKREREERLARVSGAAPGGAGGEKQQTSVKAITQIILDGAQIAEVTWEHFKNKLEAAGFHPSSTE